MITGLIIPGFSCALMEQKGPANVETVLISKDVVRLSGTKFGKIKSASIRPDPLIWSMRPPLSSNPKSLCPRTDFVGDEGVLLVRMHGHQVSSLVRVKDHNWRPEIWDQGGDPKTRSQQNNDLDWTLLPDQRSEISLWSALSLSLISAVLSGGGPGEPGLVPLVATSGRVPGRRGGPAWGTLRTTWERKLNLSYCRGVNKYLTLNSLVKGIKKSVR